MAEIMFALEVEPLCDLFDPQSLVGEQHFRLLQPDALEVFVDGFSHVLAEQGTKRRIIQTGMPRQFARAPIAKRIRGDDV